MRYVRVYFQSKGGFVHPAGDGWREVFEVPQSPTEVMVLYPPLLCSARFDFATWQGFRPEPLPIDVVRLIAFIEHKRNSLKALGVAFDREDVDLVLHRLVALKAPAPRLRTRPAA